MVMIKMPKLPTSVLMRYETIVISRPSTGYTTDDGDWVDGVATDFTIEANVQPYSKADEQNILPSGIEESDARTVYTKSSLRTVDIYDKVSADRTTIDGDEFIAFSVQPWRGYSTKHDSVLFIKADKLDEA